MSGIWFSGGSLVGSVAETTGYKSGLALRSAELDKIISERDDLKALWPRSLEQAIRLRSEEYEELITWVLYKVGNIESPSTEMFSMKLLRQYRGAGHEAEYFEIFKLFSAYHFETVRKLVSDADSAGIKSVDPTPFFEKARASYGRLGATMALELIDGFAADQHRLPWGGVRRQDWTATADLRDLFESEGLQTAYGRFVDQRFIDYLAHNVADLDRMNWRKFEGLVAEFFVREGQAVELGPGRADEGVDIRVWSAGTPAGEAPTLLIQCKRQKEKVSKVVVKALYADVLHEGAKSGLIVTTSAVSPGAKKTCEARGYRIGSVERATLTKWLSAMRTPWSGVFLAE